MNRYPLNSRRISRVWFNRHFHVIRPSRYTHRATQATTPPIGLLSYSAVMLRRNPFPGVAKGGQR